MVDGPPVSATLSKADIERCELISAMAISRLMQCSKSRYSITSSARASNIGGIVRPSAFAVLRLMTSTKFVG
jgi:hypothetical protein